MRDRMWAFTMQGEDLPQPTNRVDLDPTRARRARASPWPASPTSRIRHEIVASAHHAPRLVEVLEDMGATWTPDLYVASGGRASDPPRASLSADPHEPSRHGHHPHGGRPRTSVVDAFGRCTASTNVVVADSSVFVTSAGYGPTLTLVALAARAAAALAGTI